MEHTIYTLQDGEKIEQPGFYSMSLDRHHSQPCDGPSVTSGVLRKMELSTPADVWAFSLLNPDRLEQEDRAALWLGRAMAAYVEGGMEEVEKHFLVLADDKPSRPTKQQLNAYAEGRSTPAGKRSVEFWRNVDMDYRSPLTDSEITMIRDMGAALEKDPAACAVMDGVPEITMAWKDEQTGLWLLARPDTVSFSGIITDYKKVNSGGAPFDTRLIDRRITDHGYDMQGAFACDVFEKLTGGRSEFAVVAQWDKKPHHTILRPINESDLHIASFRNRRQIDRFADCLRTGIWPGPGDHVGEYKHPDWQLERLAKDMMDAGYSL